MKKVLLHVIVCDLLHGHAVNEFPHQGVPSHSVLSNKSYRKEKQKDNGNKEMNK
jgi:hypothetical protein